MRDRVRVRQTARCVLALLAAATLLGLSLYLFSPWHVHTRSAFRSASLSALELGAGLEAGAAVALPVALTSVWREAGSRPQRCPEFPRLLSDSRAPPACA